MRRSSSVRPLGFFHSAMSRDMLISCGIQWLEQVARYFSQAHLYLNGTSWLTSVLPLMMRLSAARTRPPASAVGVAAGAAMALSAKPCCVARALPALAFDVPVCVAGVSSHFNIMISCIWLFHFYIKREREVKVMPAACTFDRGEIIGTLRILHSLPHRGAWCMGRRLFQLRAALRPLGLLRRQ